VREIAEFVGYQDQFCFSRVFKNTVGMTPAEFRASAAESPVFEETTEKGENQHAKNRSAFVV